MRWVAPTEKDEANHALEKRLWAAADQFRANSGLKAGQYSTPVLGLIFLRFAEARFAQQRKKLEKAAASSRRGSRIDDPKAYQAEGVLFLTPCARFDYLLNRPEGSDVGKAVNEAMADIEKHNPQLKGVLPHSYALANALSQKAVTFYENGITSLNFPRRQDLLNARASRTTHPRTLFLLSEFLSHLAGEEVSISNEFRWKTKADVLEVLKARNAEDLIPSAVTCSRTTMTRGDHTHCGGCFQCVDRRFAASAVGLSEIDHPGLYTLDILSDAIADGQTRTVVLDYIRLGLRFRGDTIDSFYADWLTELSDAICLGDKEEAFVESMYQLVNRFGTQTVAALETFARRTDVTKKPVPGSLLYIIQQQEYLKSEAERFAEKLSLKLQRAIPAMFANNRPVNENDFNDKIQGLLGAEEEEYRREFPATQFALAKAIPDHDFQGCNVLVEAKYVRKGTAVSRVTDEIAADIVKYPSSAYVVFAVYDPDRSIRDDQRFIADIEARRKCKVVMLR